MLLRYFQIEKFYLKKVDLKQIQIFEFMGIRKRNIDIPFKYYPANIYLLKVNNRNARKRYEMCSKLTIKTPARRQSRRSGVFIVNLEHNSHLSSVSIVEFEQINISWEISRSICKQHKCYNQIAIVFN